MRTKVLLCAAALAASLASSMAQNVYSLNVVGYVNVTLPGQKFTAVANPLDASMGGTVANGNDMTNLFTTATGNIQAGSYFNTFVPALNDYSATVPQWSAKGSTWTANFPMPPGVGALYFNGGSSDTVVTFTGQVQQGAYTVATLPATSFSLVGSPVPIGGDTTNSTTAVGLVPSNGDSVATFNTANNDWNTAVLWSAKSSAWVGAMPIGVGQGFLYFNAGSSAKTWTSNFTVQ
jgi:hypothetical protein